MTLRAYLWYPQSDLALWKASLSSAVDWDFLGQLPGLVAAALDDSEDVTCDCFPLPIELAQEKLGDSCNELQLAELCALYSPMHPGEFNGGLVKWMEAGPTHWAVAKDGRLLGEGVSFEGHAVKQIRRAFEAMQVVCERSIASPND
jgi:hypothetical protein